MNAYVIKDHKSNYPNPVAFKSGDRVEVGVEDNEYPGWIWVVTADGNEGWAPVEYLELLDRTNQGIAKQDYCARELDVKTGDRLQVEHRLCGWYYAVNSRSDRGWVPQDCVRFV